MCRMNQTPITKRFLQAFAHLINEQKVRSGRQFALSINAYPQSFNDIKKGRRDATLDMVQNLIKVYRVSAKFIMTGEGSILEMDQHNISTVSHRKILFVQAHQYAQYASILNSETEVEKAFKTWSLPRELIGHAVNIAVQCNTASVSSCLGKGDVLFARPVPQVSWKSNLSSKKIYIIVLKNDIYIVRINRVDNLGVYIRQDDRDLPDYIAFEDIAEVWIPTSKWSSQVLMQVSSDTPDLDLKLKEQGEKITLLNATLEKWMQQQKLSEII